MKQYAKLTLDQRSELVSELINGFRRHYRKTGEPHDICFRHHRGLILSHPNSLTHLLHYYPAKILLDIPTFFLFDPEFSTNKGRLLDPFAGTGTVLLSGITHPFRRMNTVGVEINPLARMISKVKCTPLDIPTLKEESKRLLNRIRLLRRAPDPPDFPNRDFWFVKKAQTELSKIRHCIMQVRDSDFRDFFWVSFSSIIRRSSLADPRVPPPVRLRAANFKDPKQRAEIRRMVKEKLHPKPIVYFQQELETNILRLERFQTAVADSRVSASVIWDDARELRVGHYKEMGRIDKNGSKPLRDVDLVITSPPYINAQKYVRTIKLEMFWLGLTDYEQLLQLDRNYVGTERVYVKQYTDRIEIGDTLADNSVRRIFKDDPKRAGITAHYFKDMFTVLENLYRCLKPGGRLVLVVGNNAVVNHRVKNHQILINIATNDVGFDVDFVLRDKIFSRGLFTKRHYSADIIPEEWVVVLRKPRA